MTSLDSLRERAHRTQVRRGYIIDAMLVVALCLILYTFR